jgi:hypothetical protein
VTRTRCLRSAIFSLARWTRFGSARHHVLLLALLLALWLADLYQHHLNWRRSEIDIEHPERILEAF